MESKRKPPRGCRRADGLCKLTEEQKTARDAQMRSWLNQRRIERVAVAGGLLPLADVQRLVERTGDVPKGFCGTFTVKDGTITVGSTCAPQE